METHYSYIIESVNTKKWYYGYKTNLEIRLDGHNKGLNISTRRGGPWKYIFIRPFESKSEATDFEKYLKKSRNKEYVRRPA